jgi:membrane-associated PAP2 superfamily phosphatase
MIIAASFAELSPVQFLIALTLAALLAMGVFAHASKHGSRRATAWGIATFLLAGIVVPVYFIRYWLRRGRS